MYLGFVLILLGGAILAGSLGPFIVVAGFFLFMDIAFVSFEEKKLEQTYPTAWLDYRSSVRRWI
jgi:protein-S-isoprenylcysteine O-methyltransferase Ste14